MNHSLGEGEDPVRVVFPSGGVLGYDLFHEDDAGVESVESAGGYLERRWRCWR